MPRAWRCWAVALASPAARLAEIRALPAVFFRGGPDKTGKAALTASMIELAVLNRLIPGAGHLWPLQSVNDFVKLVTGWVDGA
jgi:hypothetical protein